ncbi:hypothetical protein [Lolliginicoccus levis]|uniref:hypothetical protein n=1 Tax=Lolliginicoccus levis TaxID=2919542 RepID=UPI00241DB58B|nr:hypothetical protein [Lolliginicoccus levis]
MNTTLALTITALALAGMLWTFIKVIAGSPLDPARRSDKVLLGALVLVELLTIAQSVLGVVLLISGDRDIDTLTFVLYLIGVPLILPIAVWWALGDRTRAGAGVLTIALMSVPIMVLRMYALWVAPESGLAP